MCSGPKCPCVHKAKHNALINRMNGTCRLKQTLSSKQQNHSSMNQQYQSFRKARNNISQRNHLKENNNSPQNKQEQLSIPLTQTEDLVTDQQNSQVMNRQKSHNLENLLSQVRDSINNLSIQKIKQMKANMLAQHNNNIVWSISAVLSFFSGVDSSISKELIDNKKIKWAQVEKYLSSPQRFLELLSSFEYIAQNKKIKSQNVEAVKWWLSFITSQEESKENEDVENFVSIAKKFLNILEFTGLSELDESDEEEINTNVQEPTEQPTPHRYKVIEDNTQDTINPKDYQSPLQNTQKKNPINISNIKAFESEPRLNSFNRTFETPQAKNNFSRNLDRMQSLKSVKQSPNNDQVFEDQLRTLKKQIQEKEKQIKKIKSQESFIDWASLKKSRLETRELEETVSCSQIEWNYAQRLLQLQLNEKKNEGRKTFERANRDFSFELSSHLSQKFINPQYDNAKFKHYVKKYASKYDKETSKTMDLSLQIKNLTIELKNVDHSKKNHENDLKECKRRFEL